MEARIRAQLAGHERIDRLVGELLLDEAFNRFRLLVAFARWSGLHLIDSELRSFANRGRIDALVGIDLGGTTAEALEYLVGLPHTRVRICRSGNPVVVFHPKVFAFDGRGGWRILVGSANMTTGGLFSNAEVVVDLAGTAGDDNPFDAVWRRFWRVRAPLSPENLSAVDGELLDELAPELARWSTRPPDREAPGRDSNGPEAIPLAEPIPSPGRPPRGEAADGADRGAGNGRRAVQPPPPGPPSPSVLYLEIWGETGGGTQVQFPKRVVHEFFGASEAEITWLTLNTPAGQEVNRVQIFPNNTFRIPLRFMAMRARPAVIRMTREGEDEYRVEARSQGERGYVSWLRRCTDQTRTDSKRYGMQ